MEAIANKNIKRGNRKLVLHFLRTAGAIDVARLSEVTTLSKMTVHKILDHYVEVGLVKPAGKGEAMGEVGKKPNLFRLNPNYRLIFSVQIFETSLLCAVTDLNASILVQSRVRYDKDTSLDTILQLARKTFDEQIAGLKVNAAQFSAVVLGTHGITDSENGVIITSPHFASWGSLAPVGAMLRQHFPPGMPFFIDNWIRYQAYAEMRIGAARGVNCFLVIGTEPDGLSGGLVWKGDLARGKRALAGEIGHMQVAPDSNVMCVCGGRGCLEPMVSLMRLEARARELAGENTSSALFHGRSPGLVTYLDIFREADNGDAFAMALLEGVTAYFATAINNVVQVCDPDIIIIQGEYAAAGDFFLRRLRDKARQTSLLNMDKNIQIIYSNLGGQQGVIGAAHYAADRFFAAMEP